EKLPFDTEKDFVTVGLVNRSDIHLSGRKSIPAKDFPGLLAWLKGPGNPVRFAHPGKGTVGHMQAVVLTAALGIEANLIPYRGIAPAVNDLVGEHIDLALVASAVATPQVKSGNLKAFATTSPKREAAFPDVPTFGELGYKMMERPFWHALFAPAGTPPAILQKLNAALRETLADPKVRKAYAETGVEAFPDAQSSVEAAHAYVREEMGFWGKAVRDNNVKVD
ncbi:MAG: tripartite tricarboxylate transporter substrate binding protein, partial [Variibacter sp.]|nr:tripartite tricarboxylate transporter substrate binding protein [Variibacter sp.]